MRWGQTVISKIRGFPAGHGFDRHGAHVEAGRGPELGTWLALLGPLAKQITGCAALGPGPQSLLNPAALGLWFSSLWNS
jgi:hypothetical protein